MHARHQPLAAPGSLRLRVGLGPAHAAAQNRTASSSVKVRIPGMAFAAGSVLIFSPRWDPAGCERLCVRLIAAPWSNRALLAAPCSPRRAGRPVRRGRRTRRTTSAPPTFPWTAQRSWVRSRCPHQSASPSTRRYSFSSTHTHQSAIAPAPRALVRRPYRGPRRHAACERTPTSRVVAQRAQASPGIPDLVRAPSPTRVRTHDTSLGHMCPRVSR